MNAEPSNSGAGRPLRRHSDEQHAELARRFGEALEAGDHVAAEAITTDALESGLAIEEIYSQVIAVAMGEIGERWQCGEVSIAVEHLATAITEGVMARLFPRLLRGERRSRQRVILAATQGEHHILGLRMIADTLEGAGFDVLYLGADVPTQALLEACRVHRPVVVGLSASMWLNVPTMVSAIREIAALDPAPAVFVGGRAVGRALENGLDAPVVHGCEDVVDTVVRLIDEPGPQVPVRGSLAARIPRTRAPSTTPEQGEQSVAGAFSAAALHAATSSREAAREAVRLEDLAYRDGLTGLWNRRSYDERLIELTDGDAPAGAALMLDVDDFKTINDSYGHEAGDEALIAVGRAIVNSIRPTDFGARFGGDEFVVLLPGMNSEEASAVAERIRTAVRRELTDPPVTVSIGVANLAQESRRTSLSIDQALYEAKRAGRDRVATAEV